MYILAKSGTAPTSISEEDDYNNRLAKVQKNGATVQSSLYDGDGKRVQMTLGSSSDVYAYDGLNLLYEKNLTSGTVTKHYYADGLQLC